MTTWLAMALLAPILWSISNIIDKIAATHYSSHWVTFIFLLSIGNLLYAVLIFLWTGAPDITPYAIALCLSSGLLIFCMYLLYSIPLGSVDISTIIIIHQATPLMVLIASVLFLGYTPTATELLGIILIFGGIYLATTTGRHKGLVINLSSKLILLISAAFGAAAALLYDHLISNHSASTVLMLSYAGYGLGGIILLSHPRWRTSIISDIRKMPKRGFGAYALSNLFDAAGYALFVGALANGGNVAVTSLLVSLHPLYVIVLSYWISMFDRDLFRDATPPPHPLRRLGFVMVIILGIYMVTPKVDAT